MNDYHDRSMPIGLAVMLAENNDAMRAFALMSDDDQQRVLERARHAGSRAQISALVGSIASGALPHEGMAAPGLIVDVGDRFDDPRLR